MNNLRPKRAYAQRTVDTPVCQVLSTVVLEAMQGDVFGNAGYLRLWRGLGP